MAVGIIQGLAEIKNFADYNAAASTAKYFTSYSECYDYMLENAYKSGNSSVVQGVLDGGRAGASKIIEFQPNLTGGTKAGIDVANVTESGNVVEFTTGEATMGAVPVIEIVGGILAALGLGILSYEANKDFWIDISNNLFLNVPGYVPITYDNIEDMSLLTLFKNDKTYVDADLIQQVNNYLIQEGYFNQGEATVTYSDIPVSEGRYTLQCPEVTPKGIRAMLGKLYEEQIGPGWPNMNPTINNALNALDFYGVPSTCTHFSITVNRNTPQIDICLYGGDVPVDVYYNGAQVTNWFSNHYLIRNLQAYYDRYSFSDADNSFYLGMKRIPNTFYSVCSSPCATIEITPAVPELVPLPNATPSTTPNSIPTEMPDWWRDVLEIGDIDPDTMTRIAHEFLPVSVPNVSPVNYPVTTPQADIQTGNVPDTNPTPVGDSSLPLFDPTGPYKPPSNPNPPSISTPVIPGIPAIGGQANALFTVYNPSQANLNSLGAVLWTQNIIEQIVQMFTNNPMDAIISLHILYATPATGSNKEIKLGYLPTGVSCPEVTNQYINLDCGTVRVPELYGDIRDYACTDISIYLPMVGFRQLKTEDAMASNISVNYKIDVFTGTVLANVIINRGSVNQVFYTFEGNCAVNLPLTGADKSRQLATVIGAAGAIATGNPALALGAMGAFAGGSARAQIQRSGNFTGNAGAMGCKKPYIVVSSDIAYDAVGYNTQYGFPANLTVMLGTCHGYVKAKEVHADSIANATEAEKREIESQLKQGVIIH